MLAAEKGNAAVCNYLVRKGADITLVDNQGQCISWLCVVVKARVYSASSMGTRSAVPYSATAQLFS